MNEQVLEQLEKKPIQNSQQPKTRAHVEHLGVSLIVFSEWYHNDKKKRCRPSTIGF